MLSQLCRRIGLALSLVPAVVVSAGLSTPAGAHVTATPIDYTNDFNVYVTNSDGTSRQAITSDGGPINPARPGLGAISYPWYQWSSDGNYMLLVRLNTSLRTPNNEDLLLMKVGGTALHTLVSGLRQGAFYPSWALDGDRIVYDAAKGFSTGVAQHTVKTIDVNGHAMVAWRYASAEGCCGSMAVPTEQLLHQEVGSGDTQPSMQWSIGRHLAIYTASCSGGLNVTDMRTGRTQRLDQKGMLWTEAALSPQGKLAVRSDTVVAGALVHSVLITTPQVGAPYTVVAQGELPVWSRDGTSLYFVQRVLSHMLHVVNPLGNTQDTPVDFTAIGRASADGTGVTLLMQQDAFGFGQLNSTADGNALIYSSVDNMTGLSQHLLSNHRYTAELLQEYGPQVRIQRYTIGGAITTLLRQAGRPAVQP